MVCVGIGAWVFKEAAPAVPDTSEEGNLEASLSMFNYATDVRTYADSQIAEVSQTSHGR